MKITLFENEKHEIVKFYNYEDTDEVETNQFLIKNGDEGILFDPGGTRINTFLFSEISTIISPQKIKYIVLSHQDPDVGASLSFWLISLNSKIVTSTIWERFIPHFTTKGISKERFVLVNDYGGKLKLGDTEIILLPAHFLHSEGNFQIYDPTSKILLSGDMGASLGAPYEEVQDFENHKQYIEGFHKRYLPSSYSIKEWVKLVRSLDVEQIVPQHGARFPNKEIVNSFLNWSEQLKPTLEENPDWYKINNEFLD